MHARPANSQAPPAAAALAPRRVGGHGGHVLDAADLDAGAGERAQRRLRAGAGRLGLVAAGGAELDVEGGDAELLRGDQ